MIVTQIHGGLGNQMFQYAVGRRAALAAREPLGLDLTVMATYRVHRYGLDQFALPAAPTVVSVDGDAFSRGRGLARLCNKILRRDRDVRETAFPFEPRILDLRGPARLIGFWQSEKYFSDIAPTLRADFALAKPMLDARRAVRDAIEACEAISVHVRRGDYVSNPKAAAVHGACSLDWYARAVALAAEGAAEPVFFVFSDDPVWAKDNLSLPARAVFVAPQADGRDAEDMHLMAACRRHVIANSTFSWWGAWLDPRPDARVIAPAQWFATDRQDTRDLIPERWTRL